MILVKSLIVLFLILIGFYIYNHLNFLKYFDGREGFAQVQAQQMTITTICTSSPQLRHSFQSDISNLSN